MGLVRMLSALRSVDGEVAAIEGAEESAGDETDERADEFVSGGRAVGHGHVEQESDDEPDDRAQQSTDDDSAEEPRRLLVCQRFIVGDPEPGCHTRSG